MPNFSNKLLEINEDAVRTLVPAYIYMAIVILFGILGNIVVIYFYGIKRKTSPHVLFIVALAIFDLFTCAVAMPLELIDLVRFYTFESTALCKIARFCTHFGPIVSAFTLLVIAVDRYKMFCKPLNPQITLKVAKILLIIGALIGIALSAPASLFYQVVEANLTVHPGLSAYDCTTIRDEEYLLAITVYNSLLFIQFVGAIVVLFVLYSLVARQLFKMKNAHLSSLSQRVKVKKFTAIMISITVAFVVSFLPYLILVTWRTLSKEYEPNLFSKPELILYQIALRSYFLSSAVNPLIYGFFNSDFRRVVLSLVCFCFRRNEALCFKSSSSNHENNDQQQ